MKLTHVDCYEVVVPTYPECVHSAEYGSPVFDLAPKYVIEAHTDVGIIGYGESHKDPDRARLEHSLKLLEGVELTELCFQAPSITDFSREDKFANGIVDQHEWSFSSLQDMAIHSLMLDLLGKYSGLPASALLGGAYRKQVRVDAWMGRMTPEDSALGARRAMQAGYRSMKLKCALGDPIVERLEAVKDACGNEFKVVVDPNRRFYRLADAMDVLKNMAKVGNVSCLEDPFPKENLAAYRMLREQHLFPVALHLCNGLSAIRAIRNEACDYVNLEGVPWDVRKDGDMCWAAGIATWHYSGVDLGILEATYLHTCAATQSMSRASDIFGRFIRIHNLITNPLAPVDGLVEVPTGDGLGIDVDFDALERFTRKKFHFALGSRRDGGNSVPAELSEPLAVGADS